MNLTKVYYEYMLSFGQPNESLRTAREDVARSIVPAVDALAPYPSFISAVVFVADNFHTDSAGAYAHVPAPRRSPEQTAYTTSAIEGHRIAFNASRLGRLMTAGEGEGALLPSQMNPREHQVFGIREWTHFGAKQAPVAVQFAFSAKEGGHPTDATVLEAYHAAREDVLPAVSALAARVDQGESLADRSLLLPPVTPNAIAMMWDTTSSTAHAEKHFTATQLFIDDTAAIIKEIVTEHGGEIIKPTGDGQRGVFWLPDTIDPNDRQAVETYRHLVMQGVYRDVAQQIGPVSAKTGIHIRMVDGVGHLQKAGTEEDDLIVGATETQKMKDLTGLIMFQLGKRLSQPH